MCWEVGTAEGAEVAAERPGPFLPSGAVTGLTLLLRKTGIGFLFAVLLAH